jgi:hypothetical protein
MRTGYGTVLAVMAFVTVCFTFGTLALFRDGHPLRACVLMVATVAMAWGMAWFVLTWSKPTPRGADRGP